MLGPLCNIIVESLKRFGHLGLACRPDHTMPANTGREMLPLQSILNPVSSARPVASFRHYEPLVPASSISSPTETLRTTRSAPSAAPKGRAPVNAVGLPKLKPQGPVNFAPYETVDQAAYRELRQFLVTPLGQIRQNCEHIPYNSSKKDFFEKTGRESIEGEGPLEHIFLAG